MIPRVLLMFGLALLVAAAPPQSGSAPPNRFPGLVARSLGPATMGGRVTALAVSAQDPAVQYVAAATGGIWKTTDAGRRWVCVFAGRPHASMGAVAVAPSNGDVVWVGTGEANPRNSVSWGNGVFVSHDAGKTWTHVGLRDTHHIGRIAVHPKDPRTAYVAAVGHLWGDNRQRGLFKTTDAGKTWTHALALDAQTGCIDVILDPTNPDIVYTAAYRVKRGRFSGGNPEVQIGPRAGIYRSKDGGKSWKKLTQGLPKRPMGRIGLDVYRKDPRVVFAVVQTDRTDLSKLPGQPPSVGGKVGEVDTGGVFVSRDQGDTWTKLNDLVPRPFYYGQIRVDPTDERRVWVLGIPLFVSGDGGKSFSDQGALNVHVDYHDLWINPTDPRHLVLAGDGGVAVSADRGQTWRALQNLPISQFYGIAADMRSPYRIYGGLQDNGSWGGPSRTNNASGILNSDWFRVLAFDGYYCQVPPDDPFTVYAEGQYGRLHRIDLRRRTTLLIRPREPRPDTPRFRFNWSSPLVLSPHETKTLYYGGNFVFKSVNRGQSWRIISPDLTDGPPGESAVSGHTITTIAESPTHPGVLWVGTDDGKIHTSRDDGKTWEDLSNNVPGLAMTRWINRIEPSPHDPKTAYLAVSRHRHDDFRPYLYRTVDGGKTWKSIVANLPTEGPVQVIRTDKSHPDLLFVGTEFGLYVTLDGAKTWQPLMTGLPPCPVHDLLIHPREKELVIATHGRGLYVMDIAPIQEMMTKGRKEKTYLCEVRPVRIPRRLYQTRVPAYTYQGENPPRGAVIHYVLREPSATAPQIDVVDLRGNRVARFAGSKEAGVHRILWDLKRADGTQVRPGEYRVVLRLAGKELTQKITVTLEE